MVIVRICIFGFIVIGLGNGVQQPTMAHRNISKPTKSKKTRTLGQGTLGCPGRSCRLGCAFSTRQKQQKERPKVIVNDLSTKTKTLPKPDCYSLDEGLLEVNKPDDKTDECVVDYVSSNELSRSNSLDSIISGLSDDSAASEERQNTLQSVASYLSIGSKERPSTGNDIISTESNTKEYISNDEESSEISTFTGNVSETDTNENCEETSQFSSSGIASETPTECRSINEEEEEERKGPTRCVSFITPKKVKEEHNEENQNSEDINHCKPHYRLRRTKSFDPTLEKSQTYLHGQNKNFSRANAYLTPARPGLRKLQINYTQTNTENNHLCIFADLIRTSHKRNFLTEEAIKNLERRLQIRRSDPNRSTSYYVNKGIKDPIRSKKKKTVRTIAEKDQERRDRIAKTTEEMKLGYIPTAKTIKSVTYEEMQLIRQCSYLRIDPKLQRHESSDNIQEVGS